METLNLKEKTVEAGEKRVADLEKATKAKQAELDTAIANEKRTLMKIAGLDEAQARALLLERMEGEVQHDMAALIQRGMEKATGRPPTRRPANSWPPPSSAWPPTSRPRPPWAPSISPTTR